MNDTTVLLFLGEQGGRLHVSSLDVPVDTSGSVPERGVILADIMARGRDDIVISNGSAGTLTLLLSK
jgi:hypothetical protein